jgi:hypothetical protein
MNKTLKLISVFLLMTFSTFSQKNTWTIGVYTGMQIQMLNSFERDYISKNYSQTTGESKNIDKWNTESRTINTISKYPPVELNIRYNITNNFSISSGIGYVSYLSMWNGLSNGRHPLDAFADNTYWRRTCIQIPLNVRYDIRLKKGFSFFSKLGLYMDYSVNSYSEKINFMPSIYVPNQADTTAYYSDFKIDYRSNGKKINLLINAGVGFAYQFQSGIGLSLSGEYNVGTMRKERFNHHLQIKEVDTHIVNYEYDYYVHNRSEYWNILFGITYTFHK